jgi:hypothetical protein
MSLCLLENETERDVIYMTARVTFYMEKACGKPFLTCQGSVSAIDTMYPKFFAKLLFQNVITIKIKKIKNNWCGLGNNWNFWPFFFSSCFS